MHISLLSGEALERIAQQAVVATSALTSATAYATKFMDEHYTATKAQFTEHHAATEARFTTHAAASTE